MIWLWAYLAIGVAFAAWIIYQDGLPSDWTDFLAVLLVVVLAVVLWPWFVAAACLDVLQRDKKKDDDLMKMF